MLRALLTHQVSFLFPPFQTIVGITDISMALTSVTATFSLTIALSLLIVVMIDHMACHCAHMTVILMMMVEMLLTREYSGWATTW